MTSHGGRLGMVPPFLLFVSPAAALVVAVIGFLRKHLGATGTDELFEIARVTSDARTGRLGDVWQLRQQGLYVDRATEGWATPDDVRHHDVIELRVFARIFVRGALRLTRGTQA